jgi:hypothetical protein
MWIGSPMILIVIGPMLPELHPIKSAKSSFVRPYFVVRPVASINARFGYMPVSATPVMLICRRLRGSRFGEALFPREPRPGLNWRPCVRADICSGS